MQQASVMDYLRDHMSETREFGISDLAVVELDRSEGGLQFLHCGVRPDEPAWWKLNDDKRRSSRTQLGDCDEGR